jgi:NhaP-type Na+/H+ or K+/H+ antiporter
MPPQTPAREPDNRPRMDTWSLAAIAVGLIAWAAVSGRLERSILTAPIFFVTFGLVLGNEALGVIDLQVDEGAVRILAEATLTLLLFADASRLELGALRREVTVPVRLLGVGLPLTIVLGAVVAWAVVGELALVEALVLAVVLAPTDAALGQAVVTDERIPSRIRQGLNVESGLNDGICVPLLFIALAVAEAEEGPMTAGHALHIVVEEIGYGIAGGVAAGIVGAVVVVVAGGRGLIDAGWLQVVPLASAALAYGMAAPLGGSGFIAAFVGGLVFGGIRRSRGGEVSFLIEEAGEVFNALTLVVFGAVILGPVLGDLTWAAVAYAVLSLTLVRMLPVAIATIGSGARPPTVLFLGWFGPRGLASIVFAVIVIDEASLPHTPTLLLVIFTTVALSVFAHGLTAQPLTGRYVAWYDAQPTGRRPAMESAPVHEQRWRKPVGRGGA